MPAIGTSLGFDRLPVTLAGRPLDLFGLCSVVGDRVTWRIVAIELYDLGGPGTTILRPGTEAFDLVMVAIDRHHGDEISARLNDLVDHHGGHMVLFGEHAPANGNRRDLGRHALGPHALDPHDRREAPDRTVWLAA